MADFLQWEKGRPEINPTFVDGSGPGPAAPTNILERIIWEDTFNYATLEAAEANGWLRSGLEWDFLPDDTAWAVDGTQVAAAVLRRQAVTGIAIGDAVRVTMRLDTNFPIAGIFELRYDAQVILTGITTPGEYSGVVTATLADGFAIVDGDADAIAHVNYVSIGLDKFFNSNRLANDSAITVA